MKEAESVFASLSGILRKHTAGMSLKVDEPGSLYVERLASAPGAKPDNLWLPPYTIPLAPL